MLSVECFDEFRKPRAHDEFGGLFAVFTIDERAVEIQDDEERLADGCL